MDQNLEIMAIMIFVFIIFLAIVLYLALKGSQKLEKAKTDGKLSTFLKKVKVWREN